MQRRRHGMASRFLVALAAVALWSPAGPAQPAEVPRWTTTERVVAFADIHGAYDELVALLKTTGLVGEDYAGFAADETEAMRQEAFEEFKARSTPPATADPAAAPDEAALREAFDNSYPRGFFARQVALSPDGAYGRWLLSLPAVIVVNDTAYVHGGPGRIIGENGFDLNERVRADLVKYQDLRRRLVEAGLLPKWDMRRDRDIALAARDTAAPELQALIAEFISTEEAPEFGSNGPFWYRGSVYCKPMLEEKVLEAALSRLGAKRFVVGHTPTGDRRVHGLYGGRLVMLDTGMLGSYYEGRPAALVTEAGDTWVQYAQPAERGTIDLSGNVQDYGRTEAELRQVLAEGTVTVTQKGEDGAPWAVTVRSGGKDVAAVFVAGGENELAAAALDDLLGSSLVPPAVAREVEGVKGALQLRYPGSISEAERMERGVGLGSWCPMDEQLGLMYTFDLLIANRGRSVGNIWFAHQRSDLVLTSHQDAFGTARSLPDGFDPAKLQIPPPMAEALRKLDEPTLESALGAWIGKREIRALLSRRDQLLGD